MIKNKQYILFSLTGTIIVLWQMLLPGYVLTLDMVFGPQAVPPVLEGLKAAAFPIRALVYLFDLILPMWLIQKFLLLGTFFLLFYIPLKFYPFITKYGEPYVASLIFAINPFVYERLLAGQWLVLLAYALLPAFLYFLIGFYQEQSRSNLIGIFATLFLIGMASLHFLVMGSIILFIYSLFACKHWRKLLVGGLVFLTFSMYWIIPVLMQDETIVSAFSRGHWEAFQTASDPQLSVVGNVLTLHGFWGEREYWATQWNMPKESWLWPFALTALLILVVAGIFAGSRNREYKKVTIFLLTTGLVSVVFSAGVSGWLGPINLWLFENIPFWKGFRDTQKWSGVLAMVYALVAGLGAGTILSWFSKQEYKRMALCITLAVPIFYTPMMLFGFSGQLKPVWYPASWVEADNILKADPECKALFLPWHQYYALSLNNKILTGNPSRSFFTCAIASGENMEVGEIDTQEGNTVEYYELENVVISNDMDADEAVAYLKSRGFKYIIFSRDLIDQDEFWYPFLASPRLERVINRPDLYLFKVL